ncbi:MAG: hypothetical protein AAFS10_17745, partial [Myxococcota bacterium]
MRTFSYLLAALICLHVPDLATAENYRVPAAVERQVSSVLGVDVEATQRLPRQTSMQVLQQGGIPFVRFTIADG